MQVSLLRAANREIKECIPTDYTEASVPRAGSCTGAQPIKHRNKTSLQTGPGPGSGTGARSPAIPEWAPTLFSDLLIWNPNPNPNPNLALATICQPNFAAIDFQDVAKSCPKLSFSSSGEFSLWQLMAVLHAVGGNGTGRKDRASPRPVKMRLQFESMTQQAVICRYLRFPFLPTGAILAGYTIGTSPDLDILVCPCRTVVG
ncbi:hypothetical protein B0H66DRAFT_289538 [Apodospora peruviana]|uniref:Uncharacterized protein n=1 Tax=Apodospora peruviana TaxID=516989 RepID=A0AAE0M2D0_9PEZI|nr:hypothetical protein B0H66DRAFT_289538 [Apodospora peruviana]